MLRLLLRVPSSIARLRPYREPFRQFASTIPTASEALDKLKCVLKEYRLANFDHTFPKRYAEEFVRGVDKNHDHFLEKQDFSSFLNAIDASDKLTPDELDQALREIVVATKVTSTPKTFSHIPVDKLKEVMLDGIKKGEM